MTDPVRVVAILQVQPGKGAEQMAEFEQLAPLVRAEDGCLQYDLHRDLDDADRFVVIEKWASRDALAAHAAAAHMADSAQRSAGFRAGPAQVIVLTDERIA